MAKEPGGLLVGSASRLWRNGKESGCVATSVPKRVREVLGLVAGDQVSWVPVGLESVFIRRIGMRHDGREQSYRRFLESEQWAVRVGALASMRLPMVGDPSPVCSVCHEGRAIAVAVELAVCVECDLALEAAVAQTGRVVQEGLGLAYSHRGSDDGVIGGVVDADGDGEDDGVGTGDEAA